MELKNLLNFGINPLHLLRQWLESLEIRNYKVAQLLCKIIPSQCPFERKIKLFNRTILDIPPLCKLNPFYEQLVMLRFKSLAYLADECGEDVTVYC
ncbi:Mo-dependent nitrogenase C-terminal domain-containing protein [Mastigocladopsis repens]|uniref:Mo-dependent nitrogenase C-terminal domain-containing protein n=1 Tax=Mastigocladopsis repens TaxID=221287 RepID=UPI00030C0876|nr:Mo-dependent nitrogenase C-terminal domain-containing protein [Mastigocladopsis repens]